MPTQEAIILVIIAGFTLSASPGPSMLYVLSRSIGQDRTAGLVSAAGLATGGALHAVAAAAGLSAVLEYSPAAFKAITVAGAAYLVYLGIQTWRSRHEEIGEADSVRRASGWEIFSQGVIVEVLNPKTALFFLAFLPQFVSQEAGNLALQILILGMLIPLTAVPADVVVAFTGGTLQRRIAASPAARSAFGCVSAVVLIGLGLQICLL